MNSTITILMEMASNQNNIHRNSSNDQTEYLMKRNTRTDCNVKAKSTGKRARIVPTVEPNKYYSKICQPFLQALINMMNT